MHDWSSAEVPFLVVAMVTRVLEKELEDLGENLVKYSLKLVNLGLTA